MPTNDDPQVIVRHSAEFNGGSPSDAPAPKRRGRPLEMTGAEILDRIRGLAQNASGLFRVHRRHPALYARARRQFGSWSGAVAAAGLDYARVLGQARNRSLARRRREARAARRD